MKLLKVKDVIAKNLRSKYSSVNLLSEALDLEVLPLTEDGKIHHTSLTFAEIVDTLTKKFNIRNMLDLFCGSGALSKIALLNYSPKVTCADKYTKACEINLSKFKDEVEIITGDVLEMSFSDKYDLVTIDSPSDKVEEVIEKLIPKIKADLFVMYYGGKGNVERDERIENRLSDMFKETYYVKHQLKHACCSSSAKSKEYIDYISINF